MERVTNAHRRGAVGVAMIGLMRDARLRVSEAAALTWGDLEIVPGGSGRVRVGETGYRVVSADTMRLLSSVRRGSDETEQLLGMRPNQGQKRCSMEATTLHAEALLVRLTFGLLDVRLRLR